MECACYFESLNGIAFNRVPSGPREQRPVGWIPMRGALPTRLNKCAILNRAEYRDFSGVGPTKFNRDVPAS